MNFNIEVINNFSIDFVVIYITTMLCQLIAANDVPFWRPEKFENMINLYFKSFKHLQNFDHLLLAATSKYILLLNL